MNELLSAIDKLLSRDIINITISQKRNSSSFVADRLKIRKTIIKGNIMYQAEYFNNKKAYHENISENEIRDRLISLLCDDFRQLNAHTVGYDIAIKLTKKEKLLVSESKNDKQTAEITHNRKKKYILDANEKDPILMELGIQTKEGHIAAPMYDKYKQINRFLEFIDDIASKDDSEEFKIIDFGCGKSYLTFIVYEYFIKRGRKVKIVGLDLKRDVINKCSDIAKRHNFSSLSFEVGDIKDYAPPFKPDMVISLHACDTATDFAIFNAISWGARYILSIPCCQHEINAQLSKKSDTFFKDFGLVRERFSALATDTIRAKLLEYSGYDVSVMEFIDMEHSPKNIMLRAKKKASISDGKKAEIKKELENFMNPLGINQTLFDLIMR